MHQDQGAQMYASYMFIMIKEHIYMHRGYMHHAYMHQGEGSSVHDKCIKILDHRYLHHGYMLNRYIHYG